MNRWIVLPYDESLVARMALGRAERLVHGEPGTDGGIVLAVCGADPGVLEPLVERARSLVNPNVRLEARLVAATNPGASLLMLVEDRPNAAVAVPLGVEFESPWYGQAVRSVLGCRTCPVYAFYMDEGMVKEAEEENEDGLSLDRLVSAVLRGGARLRLGVQSLIRGVAK